MKIMYQYLYSTHSHGWTNDQARAMYNNQQSTIYEYIYSFYILSMYN